MSIRNRVIVMTFAAGLLSACGGSTGASVTGSTAASADRGSSASPSACADFTEAFDHTVTQFAFLRVAVGSDLDETDRLATLTDYTQTLAEQAPECAPAAAAALTDLRGETADLVKAYVPNADGAVAEGIFTILMRIRATGTTAWDQLGKPTSGWKELPIHEDGTRS